MSKENVKISLFAGIIFLGIISFFCLGAKLYRIGFYTPATEDLDMNGYDITNSGNLIDAHDYAVCISTPFALGTSTSTLISPFRSYAVKITTITMRITGGTNMVGMIEQRPDSAPASAGTDIWVGDVTALSTGWIGGTSSDFTIPANSALFLDPTSFSGNVERLMIKYQLERLN